MSIQSLTSASTTPTIVLDLSVLEGVLQLRNPDKQSWSCLAHAPSQGRRCRNPIAHNREKEALDILNLMARQPVSQQTIRLDLEEIAELTTCYLHKRQAAGIADRWHQDVWRSYQDPLRFSRSSRSSSRTLRRSSTSSSDSSSSAADSATDSGSTSAVSSDGSRGSMFILRSPSRSPSPARSLPESSDTMDAAASTLGSLTLSSNDGHQVPISTRTARADDEECAICYEILHTPAETLCQHAFCLECLSRWLDQSHTCPMCRCPLDQTPAARIQNNNGSVNAEDPSNLNPAPSPASTVVPLEVTTPPENSSSDGVRASLTLEVLSNSTDARRPSLSATGDETLSRQEMNEAVRAMREILDQISRLAQGLSEPDEGGRLVQSAAQLLEGIS